MAFVYQSKRNFNFSTKENLSLGPGAYRGHEAYQNEPSHVPFNSATIRETEMKANKIEPGPGSYEINLAKRIKIDQFGRYKCSSSFASNIDRFNQNRLGLVPGPGSYNVEKIWTAQTVAKNEPKLRVLYSFPSVPSIPTHGQAYGYDETESGELISQKNPNEMHSGVPGDSIGPGHYNPRPISEVYGGKSTAWHKSNSKRELIPSTSSGTLVGPGSYNDNRVQSIYKMKSSPAFASNCKRDSYIPLGNDYDDLYEDYEKDGNPGPGQYFGAGSSISSGKAYSDYQKFGSGSIRFASSNKNVPGPGYYNTATKVNNHASGLKAPFASTDPRFLTKPVVCPGPGPGAYPDPKHPDYQVRSLGNDGAFGSNEKRFPTKSKGEIPGPGQYETENRVGMHNSVNRKPLSVFSSKVPKDIQLANFDNPPPGTYDFHSSFEKKDHLPMQPVLVRVNVGIDKILGFNTREERWKEKNNDIPGTYNKIRKNTKQKQRGCISKEERFHKKDSDSPGPAAYIDRKNYWNKKTFNIQFTENN